MEKRLFNNHADLTVNDIGTKVNQYIDQNISYLENNDDLIKWNDLPSVFSATFSIISAAFFSAFSIIL